MTRYTRYERPGNSVTWDSVPFGYLLNVFHSPANSSDDGADLARIFDFVEVPSSFVGTKTWLNPFHYSNVDLKPLGFCTPFNGMPRFREPGKINLNTIVDQRVFESLFDPLSWGNSGPTWAEFVDSRRGFATSQSENFPTQFANPFRAGVSADLAARSMGTTIGQGAAFATSLRPTRAGDRPLFHFGSQEVYRESDRHPYFHFMALNRLPNLTSNHSNAYAVWITVGYFELEDDPDDNVAIHPDGYRLANELGVETGNVERHRAFYVIDRSIPVGYEMGQDHNVDDCVILRRMLD